MKSQKGVVSQSSPKMPIEAGEPNQDKDNKVEKPPKEIPVIYDTGYFLHDTGDTYDGGFEIKKKDLSIKMHGHGVYTTAEGDSYSGNWDFNLLDHKEPAIVSYNNGATFEGFLKDWSYNGAGKYTYPDGSVLICDFSENCPVGNLELTDPNGHIWLGKADQGFAWCAPVNHFYDMLETTLPKTNRCHKPKPKPNSAPAAPARKGTTSARKETTSARKETTSARKETTAARKGTTAGEKSKTKQK